MNKYLWAFLRKCRGIGKNELYNFGRKMSPGDNRPTYSLIMGKKFRKICKSKMIFLD
jgi:hypothetical protein